MNYKSFYTLIVCLLLSACVSKGKYTELEASLGNRETQLKDTNETLTDLQARHRELQSENARLLGTIEELTVNLGQGQSSIREKQSTIEALTLNLGEAQTIIREQEGTLGTLKLNLSQAESAIKQKDGMIGDLRTDLGQTKSLVEQKENTISELDKTRREIENSLKEQIAQKDVKIEEIEGKLRVTFVDKILFDSGSTTIRDRGRQVLLTLAQSFVEDPEKTIVVEGHTDDVQIGYPLRQRFPSNWELSTARAASVVRFLQEEGNIKPERMTATGYSYYRPVAPNDSEESRSQNRRIEIVLVPKR